MAARVVFSLIRKNSISNLCFSKRILRNSRVFQYKKTLASLDSNSYRNYASKSSDDGQDPEQERDNSAKKSEQGTEFKFSKTLETVITKGPLRWLAKTFCMFLLKAYFDPEFDEEEFLRGAKQALVVTSEIIAEKRFEDLSKLCPPKFIDVVKDADKIQDLGPAIPAVDILTTRITNIHLELDTVKETKQVEIDVTFVCRPKDEDREPHGVGNVKIGNVKIVHMRSPRIIEYRFRKSFVPDNDNWFVVMIDL